MMQFASWVGSVVGLTRDDGEPRHVNAPKSGSTAASARSAGEAKSESGAFKTSLVAGGGSQMVGKGPVHVSTDQSSLGDKALELQTTIKTLSATKALLQCFQSEESLKQFSESQAAKIDRAERQIKTIDMKITQLKMTESSLTLQKKGIRVHDCDTLKDVAMFSTSAANLKTSAVKTPKIAWRHARSTMLSETRANSTESSPSSRVNDTFSRSSSAASNDFNRTSSSSSAASTQSLDKASGRRPSRRSSC